MTHRPPSSSTTSLASALTLSLLGIGVAHAQQATEATPTLEAVTVTADPGGESAAGPVTGFVAKRAQSATKTDTPLIETPQAISVITRDEMDTQGVTTLRETTRYTAGVMSNYFDSRVDSFSARGGSVTQYQDGMLRGYGTYNNNKVEPFLLERVEFLRGPSSVLYGQGSVGGVLNLTTKRPQPQPAREVQLQLGSHQRKQLAADMTGPLDSDGKWLYRLVAVGRDSNTQVNHVGDDRFVLAPSLTWRPTEDTSLTLQALYQRDKGGSLIGFFPWQGTRLPNVYGRIPTSTFVSEPGWDRYNTRNRSIGYLFSHRLTPDWTLRQNLRRTVTEVDYRTMYTSFRANPATGRPARPVFNADNLTFPRDASWNMNGGKMLLLDTQLEGHFRTGGIEHTLLAGVDVQRNSTTSSTWGALAPDINPYNPVYGNFTPPTSANLVARPNVSQKQLGFYLQDQLRWGDWTMTAGLRHDKAKTDTQGRPAAAVDDSALTKRIGVTYQGGAWAPYASYTESFQPLGGVDVYGTPFKPQRGQQFELGVKWMPPDAGLSGFVAIYQLREKNRKTADPGNPLNSLQLGEVKIKGLEAELKASLARNWDWVISYAYTDAVISRSNGGDQGQRVAGVPRHTAATWLSRRFASSGRGGWMIGGGLRYTGGMWSGTTAISTPSSLLADAVLAYEAGNWRVALNVNNLADKVVLTQCLARGDCFYGERRNVLLTATYRF